MSSQHTALPAYYDELNSDIDYCAWADFILEACRRNGLEKPKSALDLACGTGSMTLCLAQRGLDVIGVDSSCNMLALAQNKLAANAGSTFFINADMRSFDLYSPVELVTCCLDGINYLTSTDDLICTFSNVARYLTPDGIFIFDVNTPYKFKNIYADNAYVLESENVFCAWQNNFNPKSGVCKFYITLFVPNKSGGYDRFDEEQRERMFALRTIKSALSASGLALSAVYADTSFSPLTETSDRWHFVCRKS